MGVTTARVVIRSVAERERSVEVDLTVDTGAIYSVVPATVLASIGIEPEERRREFDLADGRTVRRDLGWAIFEVQGCRAPSRVIFGVRGDAGLLGIGHTRRIGTQRRPPQAVPASPPSHDCVSPSMHVQPAPDASAAAGRLTVERYLALVDTGVLDPDDRVELLAGVVVSMAPIGLTDMPRPWGSWTRRCGARSPGGVAIRVQQPLVLAPFSMPQPDVARRPWNASRRHLRPPDHGAAGSSRCPTRRCRRIVSPRVRSTPPPGSPSTGS